MNEGTGKNVSSLEEIKRLGQYNYVQHGDRSFHVQTEVVGTDELKIMTMILEGGGVVATITQAALQSDVDGLKSVIAQQHDNAMAEVRDGKYS